MPEPTPEPARPKGPPIGLARRIGKTVLRSLLLCLAGFVAVGSVPISIGSVELTDGTRSVRILGMIHIAEPRFYEEVEKEILSGKAEGRRLHFEGVSGGTKEEKEELERRLGESDGWRESAAAMFGLAVQPNAKLASLDPKGRCADVGAKELLSMLDAAGVGPEPQDGSGSGTVEELDKAMDSLLLSWRGLTEFQRSLLSVPLRMGLRVLLRAELVLPDADDRTRRLMSVLIGGRNRKAAAMALASGDEKIQMLYGELHLDGLVEEFLKSGPKWRVVAWTSRRAL